MIIKYICFPLGTPSLGSVTGVTSQDNVQWTLPSTSSGGPSAVPLVAKDTANKLWKKAPTLKPSLL
ncbi:hypothetical protein AB9K17_23650, partial [Salmonella enterica subsp. enterica serovar Kentucky]|uniref:hypothetical protein n=1 Tax=Salmonella enterica TaxID=28901 RepID=UPI003F4C5F6C